MAELELGRADTMRDVLLRHYPALNDAPDRVKNAFTPWTRPSRQAFLPGRRGIVHVQV
jgi:hypothetical protein